MRSVPPGGKAPHGMGKNILVISCDIAETRVALIESGIIAELHIERRGGQPRGGTVGDIYLGKVTRVLPGLQAAFVDIGLERAAFLHVEDLIRPDDFEAYLAGGRKHALGAEDGNGNNGAAEDSDAPGEIEVADEARKSHGSAPAGGEAELDGTRDAASVAESVAEESVADTEQGGRNGRAPVPQGEGGDPSDVDALKAEEAPKARSHEEAGGGSAGGTFDVAQVAVVESTTEEALLTVRRPS